MNRDKLYTEAKLVIDSMFCKSPSINNMDWSPKDTAVVVIDMINGFAKKGNLYSHRIEDIIKNTIKVLDNFNKNHIFLCDYHEENAIEFDTFLPHCQKGSGEEKVVDELLPYSSKGKVIKKNSTNGFVEPEFQLWLNKTTINQFVITGCCTDLCVVQFVLSLKTHFNRLNKHCRIVVIENAVDTYDIDTIHHPGDFSHLMSLKMMKDNGILLRRI